MAKIRLDLRTAKKSGARLTAQLKSINSALEKLKERRHAIGHAIDQTGIEILPGRRSKPLQSEHKESKDRRKLLEKLWKLDEAIMELHYARLRIWPILADRKARRAKGLRGSSATTGH